MTFKTYPYSDPNPIPSLAINGDISKFYPYFLFDGYTTKGVDQKWKVLTLENPYIKVLITPELGGKVWAAIEKSTGKEFVYYNKVIKFRDVGIRGPWTSGGIEHNFGLDLGHAPWTSNSVDYVIKDNADGSVSCFVGGPELAGRSQWRVEIRLPGDKAYFETRSLWHNAMPTQDAYLSWENAAFKVSDSMRFYFPGAHYIYHNGEAFPWPIENGRDLSWYKENNFGSHKAYHVMGTYTDWFGGYWHEENFGFGHSSLYTEAPGKKIWIWALSREGGIWEDLLTDSDGQYIEAQSGVKLNQPGANSGFHSPFTQLALRPYYTDVKTEYWFPVKSTGGMVDATPFGTLNVVRSDNRLRIDISPNQRIDDSLKIMIDGQPVIAEIVNLKTMVNYSREIDLPTNKDAIVTVTIGKNKLHYTSDHNKYKTNRPILTPVDPVEHTAEYWFRIAEDKNRMRNYNGAIADYKKVLEKEPIHGRALARLAELSYRMGRLNEGVAYVQKSLSYDSYDPDANFVYGIILADLGDAIKAEEAFSIAAWSMEYRSAAYTELAAMSLRRELFDRAALYAQKALDFNKYNLVAHQYLVTAERKTAHSTKAKSALVDLMELDPLNNYGKFENYLLNPSPATLQEFNSGITSELPYEEYLEVALRYVNLGLTSEAISVLEQSKPYPMVFYWLAYLNSSGSDGASDKYLHEALGMTPEFVFPFRKESLSVLRWAYEKEPSWKTSYYSALIYWKMNRPEKALEIMDKINTPGDFVPFYLARASLRQSLKMQPNLSRRDIEKAVSLNPKDWRARFFLSKHFAAHGLLTDWLSNAKTGYNNHPKLPVMALDFAKALVNAGEPAQALQVLKGVHVLPQEHAREGHQLYELSKLQLALKNILAGNYQKALVFVSESREWPEHLGTGRPFDPDERLQDYMAAYCMQQLGKKKNQQVYLNRLVEFTKKHGTLSPGLYGLADPGGFYLGTSVLRSFGDSDRANELMKTWEKQQDSLNRWGLGAGSSSAEVRWVLSRYFSETDHVMAMDTKIPDKKATSKFAILVQTIDIIENEK